MFKREFIYDFGLAQDDAKSELSALNLKENDRVLCIASAGEIPLEMLVNSHESVTIDAVDIAASQIYLSKLKLKAALHFERIQAAQFLGYMPADETDRALWFRQITPELTEPELKFWRNHLSILKFGPVNLGKYETYIRRFSSLGRLLLGGRKKLFGLFEAKSIEEQESYFDEVLRAGLLKNLFSIMFHPKIYKQRGISEQGLIHWQDQRLGYKFYNQFRDFCTNTPVRKNWMLQFVLFNRVLYEESLPDYLQSKGRARLREESERLHFGDESVTESMNKRDAGYYNKFALSNVSDWLSVEDFTQLLQVIAQKSGPDARGLIRYIHSARVSDPELPEVLGFDREAGEKLLAEDRFPFYKLIPFSFRKHDKI
jgi:S-adenosylmethionine:diacylglycerol 3-amino-3-carboxypropyl transferase